MHANPLPNLVTSAAPWGNSSSPAGAALPAGLPYNALNKPSGAAMNIQIPNLQDRVRISSSIAMFHAQPHMRGLVPRAVESAIREIVVAVVERSATISCITTRELVCKDFAREADENMLLKASQLMVSSLSASLALVTCREPLRITLTQNLRNYLRPIYMKDGMDDVFTESVVQILSTDNLDLGCSIVEKAVVNKSLTEISEAMQNPVLLRQESRNHYGIHASFEDRTYLPDDDASWFQLMPPTLRPNSKDPLSAAQLKVYKDFMQLGSFIPSSTTAAPPPQAPPPGPPVSQRSADLRGQELVNAV
jgi:CCR4-NOT transcription complex subunit 1